MSCPMISEAVLGDRYRFGFNGAEKIDEIYGDDNGYDLGARMYSSRLGKMFSPDPREAEYAWQSTYAYYGNSPINQIDYTGEGGNEQTGYYNNSAPPDEIFPGRDNTSAVNHGQRNYEIGQTKKLPAMYLLKPKNSVLNMNLEINYDNNDDIPNVKHSVVIDSEKKNMNYEASYKGYGKNIASLDNQAGKVVYSDNQSIPLLSISASWEKREFEKIEDINVGNNKSYSGVVKYSVFEENYTFLIFKYDKVTISSSNLNEKTEKYDRLGFGINLFELKDKGKLPFSGKVNLGINTNYVKFEEE